MNPYYDFNYMNDYSDYTLKQHEMFVYTIDSKTAYQIKDQTEKYYMYANFFEMIEMGAKSAIVGLPSPILKAPITVLELISNFKIEEHPQISNGDYTTVVALYENEDGKQVVVSRTYSELVSDYNTTWLYHGVYSGDELSTYAEVKEALPKKYP